RLPLGHPPRRPLEDLGGAPQRLLRLPAAQARLACGIHRRMRADLAPGRVHHRNREGDRASLDADPALRPRRRRQLPPRDPGRSRQPGRDGRGQSPKRAQREARAGHGRHLHRRARHRHGQAGLAAGRARRGRDRPDARHQEGFRPAQPDEPRKGGDPVMSADKRLKELGIQLAAPTPPVANYVNAVRTGNLLFLAGKGPSAVKGKLGAEFSVEQGYQHARSVGLGLLAVMKQLAAAKVLAAVSFLSCAQSGGPRSLEELKQETIRRAERNLGPLAGIKAEDAREAMAGLKSLEPDEWAAAWSRVGERHLQRGDYYQAWHSFNVARWPSERLSPGKQRAYARALEAFQQYARSLAPPIETLRIPFEGAEIVAYLRLPANARPAPLVFGINGLDSRKEEVIAQADAYLKSGVGVFAVDMPGTGQAPILVDVGAERMFSRALDYLQTRPEI